MRTSCQVATLFGIPVRLDLSLLVLMAVVWIGSFDARNGILRSLLLGTAWVLLLLLSIILHELGHCLVSMQFGCRVRAITLMLLGGRAELSHLPTRPMAELAMAVAGPLVTLALWQGGRYGSDRLALAPSTPLAHAAADALAALAYLNVRLFWFNLVPAFPMDGGRILRALLAHRIGRLAATRMTVNLGRLLILGTLIWLLCQSGRLANIHIGAHRWAIAGQSWSIGPVDLTFNRCILGMIALFVLFAAEQEYGMVRQEAEYARHGQRAPWMPPLSPEDRIVVGPPPYSRGRAGDCTSREKPRGGRWWQRWP